MVLCPQILAQWNRPKVPKVAEPAASGAGGLPLPAKKQNIAELKKCAARAERVVLATDRDREGEARGCLWVLCFSWRRTEVGNKPQGIRKMSVGKKGCVWAVETRGWVLLGRENL